MFSVSKSIRCIILIPTQITIFCEDVTDRNGTELEEPSKDEDVDGPRILFYQETNTEAGAYLVAEANAQYSL